MGSSGAPGLAAGAIAVLTLGGLAVLSRRERDGPSPSAPAAVASATVDDVERAIASDTLDDAEAALAAMRPGEERERLAARVATCRDLRGRLNRFFADVAPGVDGPAVALLEQHASAAGSPAHDALAAGSMPRTP